MRRLAEHLPATTQELWDERFRLPEDADAVALIRGDDR